MQTVGAEELLKAVALGRAATVAALLTRCAAAGWPVSPAACLFAAVKVQQLEVTGRLLAAGAPPQFVVGDLPAADHAQLRAAGVSTDGALLFSPLVIAVRQQCFPVAQMLLQHGANARAGALLVHFAEAVAPVTPAPPAPAAALAPSPDPSLFPLGGPNVGSLLEQPGSSGAGVPAALQQPLSGGAAVFEPAAAGSSGTAGAGTPLQLGPLYQPSSGATGVIRGAALPGSAGLAGSVGLGGAAAGSMGLDVPSLDVQQQQQQEQQQQQQQQQQQPAQQPAALPPPPPQDEEIEQQCRLLLELEHQLRLLLLLLHHGADPLQTTADGARCFLTACQDPALLRLAVNWVRHQCEQGRQLWDAQALLLVSAAGCAFLGGF